MAEINQKNKEFLVTSMKNKAQKMDDYFLLKNSSYKNQKNAIFSLKCFTNISSTNILFCIEFSDGFSSF